MVTEYAVRQLAMHPLVKRILHTNSQHKRPETVMEHKAKRLSIVPKIYMKILSISRQSEMALLLYSADG